MKSVMKKVFYIILALFLVIVAISAIYFLPLLSMKPSETGKITDTEIISVKNVIGNMFFVRASDGYIVVDAGSDKSAVEKSLSDENISPEEVKHILLTHTDADHVASLSLFSNAKIYLNQDELQMVNGQTKRSGNYNALPGGINLDDLILLQDEQELTLGDHKIKCISAPGHTPGSMAYLMNGEYLFSGDAFKVSDGVLSVHPYTMDEEKSKKTVHKIYDTIKESKLVLTAHYGNTKSTELKGINE